MTWLEELEKLHPCSDALEWAKQFPTAQEAWDACERGDWLFWYAARVGFTPERHRQIVRAACACVRRVLHLMPEGEGWLLAAIEAGEAWADTPCPATAGAAEAARAAAWAAGPGWATWAAGAAAGAAGAVGAAAWAAAGAAAGAAVGAAAWAAVGAAVGAGWAVGAAGWAAAEAAEQKAQADIVRQYLTCPEFNHGPR